MTLLLTGLTVLGLFVVSDRPLFTPIVESTGQSRAVVVVRDDVSAFERWCTYLFTHRTLSQSYDQVYFLTLPRNESDSMKLKLTLASALARHDATDLLLLAHTNQFIESVEDIPPGLRWKLRLVYNSGCNNGDQAKRWRRLGAESYVGHGGLSASPVFFVPFLRRWLRGARLDVAVKESNAEMERSLTLAGVLTLGKLHYHELTIDSYALRSGTQDLYVAGLK